MRVGAGDLGVGRHPVVAVRRPLLGGQKREHGGERVDREALAGRQVQHLAAKLEEVAGPGAAIDPAALGRHDLDAQVVQLEAVVGVRQFARPQGEGYGEAWHPAGSMSRAVASPPPVPRYCTSAIAKPSQPLLPTV